MALTKLNNQSIAALTDFNLSTDDLPAGSVLQVQFASTTATQSYSHAGNGVQVTTPLSCNITPLSSTSKIYISLDLRWASSNANAGPGLFRDNGTVQLGNNPNNNYGNGWMGVDEPLSHPNDAGGTYQWIMERDHHQWLDTHGKSAGTLITYDVRFTFGGSNSAGIYFNNAINGGGPTAVSQMVLMEIAG